MTIITGDDGEQAAVKGERSEMWADILEWGQTKVHYKSEEECEKVKRGQTDKGGGGGGCKRVLLRKANRIHCWLMKTLEAYAVLSKGHLETLTSRRTTHLTFHACLLHLPNQDGDVSACSCDPAGWVGSRKRRWSFVHMHIMYIINT